MTAMRMANQTRLGLLDDAVPVDLETQVVDHRGHQGKDDEGDFDPVQEEAEQKHAEQDEDHDPVRSEGQSRSGCFSMNSSPPRLRSTRAKAVAPTRIP